MTVRGALVPAVNLASNAWVFLLVIGIVLQLEGLQALAIAMYAVVLVFQLVTLCQVSESSPLSARVPSTCCAPAL